MDDQRFDELTRALAGARSRRQVIKNLAGGLAGAIAGALGLGANATAQTGPGGSDCGNNGQSCTAQQCCGGFTCLVDGTSGTEKFCCPDGNVCGQCCLPTGGVCLGGRECTCPNVIPDRCPPTANNPFGECVDLQNDLLNCGSCGEACPGPGADDPCGMAACVAGVCRIIPNPALTGLVCREAAGPCDVPEFCTGTSNQCPDNRFQPNGTLCDRDTNLCTLDTCQNGICQGGPQKTCPASTDPCKVNVCDPITGNCVTVNASDGTLCKDGNLCTLGDTCKSGMCQSGSPKTCPASTDPCKVNVCVPATGLCVTQNGPNGVPCNDNNRCTTGETCQNGTCQGGTQQTCPTGQTCVPTTGVCTCTTGVTCGKLCCTGNQSTCCPAGTLRAGQCRKLDACDK